MSTFTYDTLVPKEAIPDERDPNGYPIEPPMVDGKVPVRITVGWEYENMSSEWVQQYRGVVHWQMHVQVMQPGFKPFTTEFYLPNWYSFSKQKYKTFTNLEHHNAVGIQCMICHIIDRCMEATDEKHWQEMLRGIVGKIMISGWKWLKDHNFKGPDFSPYLNYIRAQYIYKCILYNYCGPVELPEDYS